MIKNCRRMWLWVGLFYLIHIIPTVYALPSFESPEHLMMGDAIQLKFASHQSTQLNPLLHLPSGLSLSYGEIITLGDFYQIPNEIIAQGKTISARQKLFIDAFNSFATNTRAVSEAKQIIAVIHQQKKLIDDGIKRGEQPEEIYRKTYNEFNRQFNCITGGGCSQDDWWLFPGRYLQLASTNYDHFGKNAWLAYQTGHALAMAKAISAHQSQDTIQLQIAYAMNAFACHFLSDQFASGHIRLPRVELADKVLPSVVGSLLANYMHNEENHYGLHVHNLNGDHWVVYGDKRYLDQANTENRRILHNILQASADEVWYAYRFGIFPTDDTVEKSMPIPDELADRAQNDISPLFYWDNTHKQLLRRVAIDNYYDKHWTADWWGWTTLAELSRQRGLPGPSQAQLVLAGFGKQASELRSLNQEHIQNLQKINK